MYVCGVVLAAFEYASCYL